MKIILTESYCFKDGQCPLGSRVHTAFLGAIAIGAGSLDVAGFVRPTLAQCFLRFDARPTHVL